MMAWKYTLPAFLVPFTFTLHPDGVGLLLKGAWGNIRGRRSQRLWDWLLSLQASRDGF